MEKTVLRQCHRGKDGLDPEDTLETDLAHIYPALVRAHVVVFRFIRLLPPPTQVGRAGFLRIKIGRRLKMLVDETMSGSNDPPPRGILASIPDYHQLDPYDMIERTVEKLPVTVKAVERAVRSCIIMESLSN